MTSPLAIEEFLAVTAALHAEAFVQGLGRRWTRAPCFRAESVDDDRHLADFWILGVELDLITELEGFLDLMKAMIKDLIAKRRELAVGEEKLELTTRTELQEQWDHFSKLQ